MTDDELRKIGQDFIDTRLKIKENLHPVERSLDPMLALKESAEWDFIDPLRLGVFIATKAAQGAWVVEYDHIRKVCINPAAFKREYPKGSRARSGDFNVLRPPEFYPIPEDQLSQLRHDASVGATFEGFDDVQEQKQPEGKSEGVQDTGSLHDKA